MIAYKYFVSSEVVFRAANLPKFVVALYRRVPAKTVSGASISRSFPDSDRRNMKWTTLSSSGLCETLLALESRSRRARDLSSAWSKKYFRILQSLQPAWASFMRVIHGFAYTSPSNESSNDIGLTPATVVVSKCVQTGPM
jgi:hypothetical protein